MNPGNQPRNYENLPILSIVIPCYNEQDVILSTHSEIVEMLGVHPKFKLELIYVDDGSIDGTRALLAELHSNHDFVQVVFLSRNFGHQKALTAGLEHAAGNAVAIMDADLQDPPSALLEMATRWLDGAHIVIGERRNRKEGIFLKNAYSLFYFILRKISDIDIPMHSGDFCIMDRTVVDILNAMPERNRFLRGLRAWVGYKQVIVPYDRAARSAGKTKYSFSKLLRLAFDGFVDFSSAPLTLIFFAGLFMSVLALFLGLFFFLERVLDFAPFGLSPSMIPGFSVTVLLILLFGGGQMFCIGIVGQYMARMYDEIKQRPIYLVEKALPCRAAMKRPLLD